MERVFSGDTGRFQRGCIDKGREIPAAGIEAAGAQILEREESRQPILVGRPPTPAAAGTAPRGLCDRPFFLGKPPFQRDAEEVGKLLQRVATGPVSTALQIPMNISLVVGPERARNADVSRAIDCSRIRSQEEEPLADRPIDLGVELQVIELVVPIRAQMRLVRIGLVVKQPEEPQAMTAIHHDGSPWESAALEETMYFAVDLGEGEPSFVEVHVTIAATEKAQGFVTMAGKADGLVFTTHCAIRRVDGHQGIFH